MPSRPVVDDTRGGPVTLHVIDGVVTLHTADSEAILRRGQSVLVPAATRTYEVTAGGTSASVIIARVQPD